MNNTTQSTQRSINELRRLSGLTWEQLALLFNVSSRTIHLWASGKALSINEEQKLNEVLDTIHYINRGSASTNRILLMELQSDNKCLLDVLILGQYEEVKLIAGPGNVSIKPKLIPLSEEALKSKMPPNPADLVDAMSDNTHLEIAKVKPGKALRIKTKDV